ncbi:MAG: hypothetical protein IPM35_02635 [Myxococcales bacterium]|nr:hypothetical protein [Myxococcales bacterium]
MTLRNGHGNGAGVPRIEVLPADELPAGLPAPHRPEQPEIRRDAQGRPADIESARALGSLGGQQSAGKSRLARRVALADTFADPRFTPYARAARAFRRLHVRQLAQSVGGGQCGPAPSSIVSSAALQLAASRFAFEVLGDMQLGSRLADASRQNLLAAHELCAKEALARPRDPANDPIARMRADAAARVARPALAPASPPTSIETTATENASAGQPEGTEGASPLATVARRRLAGMRGDG